MTEQEDTIINALFVSMNGTSMSYYVTKAAMDKYCARLYVHKQLNM